MVTKLSIILLSGTLLAAPAFAQTATTTTSTAASSSSFVTEQTSSQWRASKLIGVDVYGVDNVKIGDINEVLLDSSGGAKAVVIGVGGFLGIGEKNVAVPYGSLEWSNEDVRAVAVTNAPTNTASTTANVTHSATNALNSAANSLSNVGGTAATMPARTPEQTAAYNGYPNHAVLRLSKADLQNAAAFRYYADRDDMRASNARPPSAPAARP